MTTPPRKPRRRRFLQFSLRALLVFVLLASIGMSWLAVKLQKARRQTEAVEAIRRAGGRVTYDYQSEDSLAPPLAPEWAHELLGDDFLFDVVEVSVLRRDFGDDEARHLKVLTNLVFLDLSSTQITDAGLEHLEALTNLTILCLGGTQITGAGLERLRGLTNLEVLILRDTQVTPEGVEKLKEALPECQIVHGE